MSSSDYLDISSALQSHSSLKAINVGISCTDKLNMTYNYINIIWVQDQAFTDWHVILVLITEITNKITQKGFALDLAIQYIKNLNT